MATRTRGSKPKSPVLETMNGRLADLIDLHWQIKQAHWNVTGPNFIGVHRLFDEQADAVRLMADTVAERMRSLQEPAEGTIRKAVTRTTIDEFPAGLIASDAAITALLERYEQQSAQYKDAAEEADEAGDIATNDMYVEMIRTIDLAAYFLRAHLGS